MPMDPLLQQLGAELRRTGHAVVPHGDHLCVRLAFFASVRIRLVDGVLRCEKRFGLSSSELAVFGSTSVLATATAAAFALGAPGPVPFVLAFVSIFAALLDVTRMTMTEAVTTRIHLLFTLLDREVRRGIVDASVAPPLAAPRLSQELRAHAREPLRTPAH